MKIDWLRIKGFRNFDNKTINFNDKTLIIGANDVGKTNMMYALRLLLDKSLSLRDLELNNSDYNVYTKAEEIEITLKITDIKEDCLRSIFVGDIKDGCTYIQYKNNKNGELDILTGPAEELLESRTSRFYLKRLNLEYVDTNRDLVRFIKKEKQNLLKVSKDFLEEDETKKDEEALKKIQTNLNNLNNEVDNLNYIKSSLDKVNAELSNLAIHNEEQEIKFITGSTDAEELLDNLELSYSDNGDLLKIGGDGRNNQIFLSTWIAKQKAEESLERVTIFAIEEPEAHLHPHQQRKLSEYLINSFENQIFVTSHSPQIASEFKPNGMVRLYSKNKITQVAQGGCSKDIVINFDHFGYRLNVISSEIFFSNAVFLVEGSSEILFYKALSRSLGIDLDYLNISILSVEGIGFKPYIKICKALEIPFVMRTDDDIFSKMKKGNKYYYFAGISRAMGIYNELLSKADDDVLSKYWEENKINNEWQGEEDEWTDVTKKLNHYVRKELENSNIYLSWDDLEKDIIDSSIFNSLSEFYDETDEELLLKVMQKRKAENMLKYLEESLEDLSTLKEEDIAKPLLKIKNIVKKVVAKNGD